MGVMREQDWQAIADAGIAIVFYENEEFYQVLVDDAAHYYGTGITVQHPEYPIPSRGWFFIPRWPNGGPESSLKGPHGRYPTCEAALVASIEMLVHYIEYLR
jgi:hypothetical protein